jgi:hypothetical protein
MIMDDHTLSLTGQKALLTTRGKNINL